MNTRRLSIGIISALFAASLSAGARADLGGPSNPTAPLAQNGSAFTYQGQLRKNGAPVNASCNASFSLFDAATGGVQVGGTVTSPTLQVANGLFTIPLDFGWNFTGEARWLETAIGCGESPTTLAPRTALRPAPYAFALPGMRTVPGNNDGGGNPTMNVIGGVVNGVISNTISASSFNSAIGGGDSNRIDNGSYRSAIGGGILNRIDNGSDDTAIGGGYSNRIDNFSYQSAIGGGILNRIDNGSHQSAIGGGYSNRIDNGSSQSAIGGGESNRIDHASDRGVIAGGSFNRIDQQSNYSAVGGGVANIISGTSAYGKIGGGYGNRIEGISSLSTIGGGFFNVIENASDRSSIAGGNANRIGVGGGSSVIAGGTDNRILNYSSISAIGGGSGNIISDTSGYSAIGGGIGNRIEGISSLSTIGGGYLNVIENTSDRGVIAGGHSNYVGNNSAYSAVGGGIANHIGEGSGYSSIGGGADNRIDKSSLFSAIGGGQNNVITTASRAVIAGGYANRVEGDFAFAAGCGANALHDGAFVWGDGACANIQSSAPNQFIVRASGGAQFVGVASPAATQLTVAGVISTSGGVKFPDGKTQTGAAATPSNIVIVAKSGGHFSTISAALTSITDNSATNRYLVYVAPGTYTETVTMKPFVDIEGAGELATKITQVGGTTVIGASNAELRFLTVENTGGSCSVAIYNLGVSPLLTHVTALASGTGCSYAIDNDQASPTLTNVTAIATGSTGDAVGLHNYRTSMTIKDSIISASGGASNYGFFNFGSSGAWTIKVNNSQIAGATNSIRNSIGFTTTLAISQLSGGAIGGSGGTMICVGVFDENHASAGYTTCP